MADLKNILPEEESIIGQDSPSEDLGDTDISDDVTGNTATAAAAGLGLLGLTFARKSSYLDLTKMISEQSEAVVEKWKKEEEDLKKKPPKKIDPNRPKNETEAKEKHLEKAYDSFARISNKQAKKWTKEHPEDIYLAQAIDRVEIEKNNLSFEEYLAIRSRYVERASKNGYTPEQVEILRNKANNELDSLLAHKNPDLAKKWAREKGDAGISDAINRKRLADIERAKEEQSRISKLLGLNPASEYNDQAIPVSAPAPQSSLKTVSKPSPATHQATPPTSTKENAPSKLGAARPKRKSAGLSTGLGKGTVKGAAKALLRSPTFWIIAAIFSVIAIIVFAFIIMVEVYKCEYFAVFFGDECQISSSGIGREIPPPPDGYTIKKEGPKTADNGASLTYTITITYDSAKANYKPEQLILWDEPKFSYSIEDGSTTKPYTTETAGPDQKVAWRLSEFFNTGDTQKTFTLTLKPQTENEVVINTAYIPSPDSGWLPPRPSMTEFESYFTIYDCTTVSEEDYVNCEAASTNTKSFVYNRLADPLRSDKYRKLLTEVAGGTIKKIRVYMRPPDPASPNGFTGEAKYGGDILQYWGYMENGTGDVGKWSMIHETGHIIELRNPENTFNDFRLNALAKNDPDCYEERNAEAGEEKTYFITYNEINVSGSSPRSESFAEVVGANVVCSPTSTCDKGGDGYGKTITNYPKKCSDTYDWVKETIYGGVDFFGLSNDALGDLTVGRNEAPTRVDCDGTWAKAMSETSTYLGGRRDVNFGDPVCTYTKPKWNAYLEQTETNSNLWEFWKVIGATEGTANTGSKAGWGRFQMNTRENVFKQPQSTDVEPPIRGDVTWQRQIENAVARNNYLTKQDNAFGFWGTAMCLCYFDYYRNNNAWCKDIVSRGRSSTTVSTSVRCPRGCQKIGGNDTLSCSYATNDYSHGSIDCAKYQCYNAGTERVYNAGKF